MKKKYKCLNLDDYILPGYEEITGDELFRINGGGRIDNSNEAVAQAEVGDTLIRDDGTEVTITQGDIDWAKDHLGGGNDSTSATPDPVNTNPSADPTNPAGSTSTSSNPSSTSSENSSANSGTTVPDFADPFAPVSNGNFGVDNVNQIISADINNPQSVIDAYNSYYIWGDKGYKFQLKDGDDVVHTFSEAKYVRNYVETLDISKDKRDLIAEEKNVKSYLKEIEQNPENYSIEAYQRKALFAYSGEINKTLIHSLYVITDKKTGEKSTLSFNGAGPIGIVSKGAWGLNTKTDVKSWSSYVEGDNDYDMFLYRSSEGIDVQKTAANIISSINSDTSYMALDHKWDWFKWENCNTALYNTMGKKQYDCYLSPLK